ncbi:MAG: OmpA family protein [Acetobacteraceae bacterium]|nr:OmpA family protein [Acetobacteraceae bacterium]
MTRIAGTAACVPRSAGAFLPLMRRLAVSLVLLGDTGLAQAQVTVDLHALDALPPSAAPPRPARRAPPRRPVPLANKPSAPPAARAEARAPPTVAPPTTVPLPSVATGPPPAAVALPSEAPAPAAPQLAAPSPTAAQPAPPPPPQRRTLRVGFAPGQSDLTPPEAGALAELGQGVPKTGPVRIEILAYAPAAEGDASAARRLSLARALAVRSALAGAGVPAGSITLRALGSPPAEQAGDADTAIGTVMGTGDSAAPKQGKQP